MLLASALVAALWGAYVHALTASPFWAALTDAALIGLSGLVVLDYTTDRRLLLWAMLGGATGTWFASRWLA